MHIRILLFGKVAIYIYFYLMDDEKKIVIPGTQVANTTVMGELFDSDGNIIWSPNYVNTLPGLDIDSLGNINNVNNKPLLIKIKKMQQEIDLNMTLMNSMAFKMDEIQEKLDKYLKYEKRKLT